VVKSLPTSLYERGERGIFSRNEIETQSAEYVTVFTDIGTKPTRTENQVPVTIQGFLSLPAV
jgi:hypothetical protein